MSFIDGLSAKFSKVAKDVAKGTNKVVETSKLSLTLVEKKDNLNEIYAKIGKAVSELNDEEIIEKLGVSTDIKEAEKTRNEIVELKIKISELKNTKKCPDCGANVGKNSAYCSVCGSKLN